MSDESELTRRGRVDRRKFLAGVGTGAAAGLAGCGGEGDQPTTAQTTTTTTTSSGGDEGTTTTEETTETTEDGETTEGGRPVIGMPVAPATLNPLQAGTEYSFYVIDRIYNYGTENHPGDQSFQPWAVQDWTLEPDNVGSSDPALVAELRDDLEFDDGEALTAEDMKFTLDYILEQEPTGSINASNLQAIESVTVDSPDGTTVSIFLSEPTQMWFTSILGTIMLPQHIWSNVSNFDEYSPRENGGPIGAGPWELADYSWENWFELDTRSSDVIPYPGEDHVDWLHEDAPFVDGLRFEIFGSQNALEQALLNGDIDGAFIAGGATVSSSVQAQEQDGIEVYQSPDAGYNHTSWNMRRVPFDDVAFRQLLRKLIDGDWIVEVPHRGLNAQKGDYASIKAFPQWRPPAPTEIEEFEGIEVPDLTFPGEAGSFQLTEEGVQAARDFLVNHPDAKHDYSFGEGQTDITTAPDGQELYVNGEHLNEAHTDNDGNGGQGPLVFSFQPPQEDIYQSRTGQQFVGILKNVGIPIEPLVKTINAQTPTVYAQEDFDIFSMGWGLTVNMTHFSGLYSSDGADLDGTQETQTFNPMAYTNADDLIEQDLQRMDFEERIPIVKQILAQIWRDAPTAITTYGELLEPVNTGYEGWVEEVGGVQNQHSYLNLRQSE